MENSDHSRAVDLLYKILHNIACKDEAEQLTYYQVYPLDTSPRTQHVPNVYKNHLAGLFYKLDLLYIHNKSQIRKRALDRWNAFCFDKPYNFNFANNNKSVELEIDKGNITRLEPLVINTEEQAFLKHCRIEYISVAGTNANDDTNANTNANTNTDEQSNKRPISPEPDDTERKRTKQISFGRNQTEYTVPRSAKLVSIYSEKKAKSELEGKQKVINDLIEEQESLRATNISLQKDLEDALSSAQSSINEIAELKKRLLEKDKIIQGKDAEIQDVTTKIDQLEMKVRLDRKATRIGKIMLDLPKSRKTWRGTKESFRFYALACSIIPGASSTYLQMAIPLVIIAFLYDIGIGEIYDELTFVTNLCPSNKSLDYAQFIFQEFILTKLAGYFNSGAVASVSHDKGERKGLGRLLLVFAFNNKANQLDPNWWDGIVSLLLNADGVKSTDDEIAKHILKQMEELKTYLNPGITPKISSFTTDAGGGGGTKEGCFESIKSFDPHVLNVICYVITCSLHGHSKPLENAWTKSFGDFGIGEETVSQCMYNCWYMQENLGENFKGVWYQLTTNVWAGLLLSRMVLTRWGYPLDTVTKVADEYEKWLVFTSKCYEGYKTERTISKIGQTTYRLLKNDEVRVSSYFLASFNRYYWSISYNWLRRKDENTKKEGHISHECLLHFYLSYRRLEQLLDGGWKRIDEFKTCFEIWKELDDDDDDDDDSNKEKKLSSRASVLNRFTHFIKDYQSGVLCESGWGRWFNKLLTFGLATTNWKAAQILADFIVSQIDDRPVMQVDGKSEETIIHSEFEYKDFQNFLLTYCNVVVDDDMIIQNHYGAIKKMASGVRLYDDDDDDDDLENLRKTRDDVILTSKAHSQEVEHWVNRIGNNAACGRSEATSSAMAVGQSHDHQLITIRHQEDLQRENRILRGNRHMTRGTASERQSISNESKMKKEQFGRTHQKNVPRSQPSKDKAKFFIRNAMADPYPVEKEIWGEMKAIAKKKMKNGTSRETRKEQELATLQESLELNDDRKLGLERGKARDASRLTSTELTKPATETKLFNLSSFRNMYQLKYFVEEFLFRAHPGFSEEMTRKREEERKRVLSQDGSSRSGSDSSTDFQLLWECQDDHYGFCTTN